MGQSCCWAQKIVSFDCSSGFCQLQLSVRQWPYWKLLGVRCQQIHKLTWKKQKEYISISRGSRGPAAVVCRWYPPWLVTQRHNPELSYREGKCSKSSGPRHLSQQFRSPCHKRESRRSGFSAWPRAADPALLHVFAKAGYFSSYPKTDSKLARWTPCLVNGCLQDQSLSEFMVLCHIHGKDCAAPYTARSIALGQTSQADCSTADTN